MTTETAQSNEERVRAVWEWVDVRLAEPFEGIEKGKWTVRLPLLPFSQVGFNTEAEAWAAVWEYTEAALEEVRNIGEEISATTHEFKKASVCGVGMGPLQGRTLVWSRILARLQSLLAAKSAGMEPEALTPANLQDTAEPEQKK